MRILESERILLKPIEEEDIYKLLEIRWDREVMELSLHEPISRKNQLEWYKSLGDKDLALSVFLKQDDGLKLMGTIGLYDINMRHQRAVFRMRLDRSCQRPLFQQSLLSTIANLRDPTQMPTRPADGSPVRFPVAKRALAACRDVDLV